MPASDSVRGRIPIAKFKARCGAVACKNSSFDSIKTNALKVRQNLTVGEDATIGNDLIVDNNTTIGNDLVVNNDATIQSNLAVNNNLTVANDVTVCNNLQIKGCTEISCTTVDGCLTAEGLDISGDVDVDGNMNLYGTLSSDNIDTCDLTVNNNLVANGDSVVSGMLIANGDLCLNANFGLSIESFFVTVPDGATGTIEQSPTLTKSMMLIGTTGATGVEGFLSNGSKDGQLLYIVGNDINPASPYVLDIATNTTVLGNNGPIIFNNTGDIAKFVWYNSSWIKI